MCVHAGFRVDRCSVAADVAFTILGNALHPFFFSFHLVDIGTVDHVWLLPNHSPTLTCLLSCRCDCVAVCTFHQRTGMFAA